ncbi:hypothetical protein FB567DRAFT_243787 [Paraphoma chrysanthemicola]|uniref:Secreted protein n=1 Tax=Paraphoma chrysanthemicola TaxID=798071 RepID=A0A8K0QT02_9PLEO|nr:hypothetical protein FB567DRAFT_243787 [Paraphoma chrysanthemicola]
MRLFWICVLYYIHAHCLTQIQLLLNMKLTLHCETCLSHCVPQVSSWMCPTDSQADEEHFPAVWLHSQQDIWMNQSPLCVTRTRKKRKVLSITSHVKILATEFGRRNISRT